MKPETRNQKPEGTFLVSGFWFLVSIPFWLTLSLPAIAQETEELPQMVSAIVPVVGNVDGINGTRWQTNLELHNDYGQELTVALTLATAPDALPFITTVPPRSSVFFPDVVLEMFARRSLSPLLIQTMGTHPVSVRANVFAIRGDEVSTAEPIPLNTSSSYFPMRALHGLTFSDDYRTNIGLVNIGEATSDFVLALQRIPGRNLAVTHLRISAHTLLHVSIQTLFPLIDKGEGFTLVVETGESGTYAYASVIENASNTATFVQPAIGSTIQ